MKHRLLERFQPSGREKCLCGSGERFKNCCKDEWQKHDYTKVRDASFSARQSLKYLRAHITWYRLCHVSHTVPLMGHAAGKEWLDIDIKALRDLVRQARQLHIDCGVEDAYGAMLNEFFDAIDDVRWQWVVSTELALYNIVMKSDPAVARLVLSKYKWQDVHDSELLEVYIDAYSDSLGHIEIVELATKVVQLSQSESSRFHYRFLIAIQHFLLNEPERAETLARQAVKQFDAVPAKQKSTYGRWIYALGVMQLGQILDDELMLRSAIELLVWEANEEKYTNEKVSELWQMVGECYRSLKEFYMAEKLYVRSISICPMPLTHIYMAESQLALGRAERAKEILDGIDSNKLSLHNFFDYAVARCKVAISTKSIVDKEYALRCIKAVDTKEPYFKDLIHELLVSLYELPRAGGRLVSILEKINKYVTLNPNVAGVGVDFNSMIEEYLKGRK